MRRVRRPGFGYIVRTVSEGVKEDELKAIEAEIRKAVNESADFAEQAPEPDPAELYTDVLVENY